MQKSFLKFKNDFLNKKSKNDQNFEGKNYRASQGIKKILTEEITELKGKIKSLIINMEEKSQNKLNLQKCELKKNVQNRNGKKWKIGWQDQIQIEFMKVAENIRMGKLISERNFFMQHSIFLNSQNKKLIS